jgi:hypothetical protein
MSTHTHTKHTNSDNFTPVPPRRSRCCTACTAKDETVKGRHLHQRRGPGRTAARAPGPQKHSGSHTKGAGDKNQSSTYYLLQSCRRPCNAAVDRPVRINWAMRCVCAGAEGVMYVCTHWMDGQWACIAACVQLNGLMLMSTPAHTVPIAGDV